MKMRMGKTSKRTLGRIGLLTQWIVRYGYLPIVLIGMVGLALDIGTREWTSDDTVVTGALVVAPPPVVAETIIERQPPAVEIKLEPKPIMQLTAPVMAEDLVEPPPPTMETKVEPKPTQLAALNPHVRLLDEPDQPASKGYIMYANLPTDWTPVPLPAGVSSASTPHTDNIRAEIEQAAKLFDVDIQMMKAFARIEFWLQSESEDRLIQVPVPAFQPGVCQILAGQHLRHPRLLGRGGQKVCD